jgi:putative acetyltransferase
MERMPAMEIRVDDLSGTAIAELLLEHMRRIELVSQPESRHALNLDGLRQPGITFWSAWHDDTLAGCGALKQLDAHHAEIKSMRTAWAFMRKGVAAQILQHLIDESGRRSYRQLSLETGSMDYFEPARRLYAKFGFSRCGPFGGYIEDPNSVFMTRYL